MPSHTAIGTWSGGRFLHFGEPVERGAPRGAAAPRGRHRHGPDRRRLRGRRGRPPARPRAAGPRPRRVLRRRRDRPRLLRGRARGREGLPALHRPAPARAGTQYADYVRMATERSLERIGVDAFDLLLLHNPDRTGYTSETVWEAMARGPRRRPDRDARRRAGPGQRLHAGHHRLPRALRRADRLGDGHPQPARAVARRAVPAPPRSEHDVDVITRVVDYGGLFWDDVLPGHAVRAARPPHVPPRRLGRGGRREARAAAPDRRAPRADDAPARRAVVPGPRAGRLRRPDADPGARRRRAARSRTSAPSWLATPAAVVLNADEVAAIRAIGDNTGSMTLKGAAPDHEGEPRPDRWPITPELAAVARRWGIEPDRDLRPLTTAAVTKARRSSCPARAGRTCSSRSSRSPSCSSSATPRPR